MWQRVFQARVAGSIPAAVTKKVIAAESVLAAAGFSARQPNQDERQRMSKRKLNQVLAIEKGVKKRTYDATTEMHKAGQVAALFQGHSKTYEPVAEDGVKQAPQSQKVQKNAEEMFVEAKRSLSELFDVTATKDWGNQKASANLVVDGKSILENVPATYLLFLDKQLSDIRDLVGKMTELDGAVAWTKDQNTGLFNSPTIQTQTTAKVQKPIVLYGATDKHPAQTQLITEDQVIGHWYTVKHSGALPAPRKKALLERIQKLLDAVKHALEEANMTQVEEKQTGEAVLGYIFG